MKTVVKDGRFENCLYKIYISFIIIDLQEGVFWTDRLSNIVYACFKNIRFYTFFYSSDAVTLI